MTTRRFFLATAPDEGEPRLAADEAEHLVRVLRLGPGERIEGLDGRGRAFPLEVRAVAGREVRVAALGPPREEPEAGEPGAPLPFVELVVGWPRAARAEPMVERLVQLGVSAVTPLDARGRGPEPAPRGRRRERLVRIARSACKQSGRLWVPDVREPIAGPDELGPAQRLLFCDPDADVALLDALEVGGAARGVRARPLVVVVGPEGGLGADERRAWEDVGAEPVRLHPFVLRVETAAAAALAVVAAYSHSRSRSDT